MKRWKISWVLCVGVALSLPSVLRADDEAKPQTERNPEQLFKELDKNTDGKLSSDEINEDQKRFFERLIRVGDKDSDGKLTLDEFKAAAKPDERPVDAPAGDAGRGERNPEEMFKRLDKNGDGKITKDEVPEPAKRFLDPLFERLGKDALTQEDLQQARSRLGQGGFNPEVMFNRLDKNGDGKVSKDEVTEQARPLLGPLFERLGKDALTKEDLQQARERMMAQFGPGRPREGERRPGGDRPREGQPGGDRPREGRPGEGDRPNPEEFFKRLDANNDGKITLDEAPDRARPMVERMLERMKKDKGGAISKEEFVEAMKRMQPEGDRRGPGGPGDGRGPGGERGPADGRGERAPGGPGGDRERGPGGPPEGRGPGDGRGERGPGGDRGPGGPPDGRGPGGERERGPGGPPEGRGREDGRGPGDARAPGRPGEGRGPDGGRRPPLPRFFSKLDSNQDGRISPEELSKAAELFKELDENQDGQLDPRELLGPPPNGDRGDRGPGDGRGPGAGRGPGDARGPGGAGDGRGPGRGPRGPEGRPEPEDRPEGERRPERPEGDKPREE